ncbi:MAG: alpha/beta hydrolase [Candidatus Omnitrophota bacterium]
MKKIIRLFFALFIVLTIGISGALAQNIKPAGEKAGTDKNGNPVYQVDANGIKIGYELIGSGDPLIMIMGLGGTMEDWPKEAINILSKRYQLILMDNRGMGYSTADDAPFTYELFASDIISLLDALKVRRTNVLGFSMGSTVTQWLLLKYPERFNRAIIYATSTDGSSVVKALEGKTPDNPIITRQIEATARWKTPLTELPSIDKQVMLLVGTADTVVGTESSKMLASAIPGAWLVQFPGKTHRLMNEAPEEFSRIVVVFLEISKALGPDEPPENIKAPESAKQP